MVATKDSDPDTCDYCGQCDTALHSVCSSVVDGGIKIMR